MTLMNPGPVNVTDRVRDAQLRGDLCHREPEFSDLMGSIRKKLLQAFDIEKEYSAILITGVRYLDSKKMKNSISA